MILKNIMNLSYDEYIVYLKVKYGIPNEPYFNVYSTGNIHVNSKNSRTSEGLMIHHVYENQYVYLSNEQCKDIVLEHPETQLPENLVYCNYLEHLILHIKITEETNGAYGWCGIISIINHINSLYNYYYIKADINFNEVKNKYKINCINKVINQLNDYLYLVDYIMDNVMEKIIIQSEGIINISSLSSIYEKEESFCIIKNRIKIHKNYHKLYKMGFNIRQSSKYKSLSEVYSKKYNIDYIGGFS